MNNHNFKLTILFLLILSGFLAIDVVTDIHEGLPFRHWFHELSLVSLCLLWILYQFYLISRQKKTVIEVINQNVDLSSKNDAYKNRLNTLKQEFGAMIGEQLEKWHLTKSEIDIANLLIKGATMKEIAELRGSKESTIRQQATSIYKKSGLENRNQLSAYFLDY